ncbi:MAG: LPS assembly protein LptD [Hyphomonadaceae bacterium]|nr:LPS assembly protein LptD [Hyphomonadaceae bacterium]
MVLRLTCLASAMVALSTGVATAQTPADSQPPAATDTSQDLLLRADLITEDRNGLVMTAEGNVEVRVGERTLRADRLVYDQDKKTMRAQGHVEISDQTGAFQFADEIEVDEDFRNGFATRFSARLGGNSIVTSSSAVRTDGTRNSLEQVVFTNCPICEANGGTEPTWSIRARRAVQNTETQMITYQDAVFEIKGVPVLYLPYFAHPDPTSKRRSGLMIPDFGNDSKYGLFYEQPYYWSISPSQDVTISPTIFADINPLFKVDYRKRFFSGFIDLESSITHEQEFNSDGDRLGDDTWRSHLYGTGKFNIDQNWQWGFGVERQSDDLYDQRYDIDGEDDLRGLVASQPRQLLSQIYTTGQHPDFYFEAAAYVFQGLRAGDDDAQFPKVAPTVFAQKVFDLKQNGQIATDFSAVGLFRDARATLPNGQSALDTARVTSNTTWNAQYVFGPGFVLAPFGQARGDYYRVDSGLGEGPRDISRVLGAAGAQLSYPVIRRGENIDIIVEPIAMVSYATTNPNSVRLPNEDTLLFEADESNILKPTAISTYDLWEGGGRTAFGVNTTVRFSNKFQVSSLVARRWRQEEDTSFNDLSNLRNETSDYVASVRADLGNILAAGARLRMDDNLSVNRIDVDAQANIWRVSGGARYFKIAETPARVEDEGLVWNGTLKVTDRWSAIVEQARNITQEQDIRLGLGIAYQDDCSYFALIYERNGGRDRILGPSESISFRFALTGLGAGTSNN